MIIAFSSQLARPSHHLGFYSLLLFVLTRCPSAKQLGDVPEELRAEGGLVEGHATRRLLGTQSKQGCPEESSVFSENVKHVVCQIEDKKNHND